jgi:hypothetical protein
MQSKSFLFYCYTQKYSILKRAFTVEGKVKDEMLRVNGLLVVVCELSMVSDE